MIFFKGDDLIPLPELILCYILKVFVLFYLVIG